MIVLSQIVELLNLQTSTLNSTQEISHVRSITDADFDQKSLGWCSDKNAELLTTLNEGIVIVSFETYNQFQNQVHQISLIPVEKPRSAFLQVLREFFAEKPQVGFIHPSAIIDSSVIFNHNTVNIAANVVVEKECILGNHVSIGANTVIKSRTIIGDNCSIGSNNTIGGVGFGYELNDENEYELMPHIGNVVLKNGVEIGNNVCIDRAVMGSTLLEENVKVDNLVHIAHGVKIGKNSLIIANAMIAGSVEIGKNVWVSPSASVRQKLIIEDNSLIGLGSVVVKNVSANSVVAGNPAKPFEKK
ncbi:UDP-3-O-(3-hydroxymyristoyl)glucosamine N-acyltransferase [Fluviicola taffensis]|uniref:Transferase hexapeptide repeat containing protein n=1 Tax=Fluviicola taffensis (strain DSM 16823 / NCIMB 13979 / RW262) TaxID=755732 RepID=F2IA19_FLUTR|nr:UDP-3-O-(3-hydroxymyristoyl)glucosamine N-acyltransferase [Fluviicola taffensis]AEA44177.1 transferase hexapeptide repeat containing protein [Fluviicola taffensis DSM 16823]